MRIDGRGKSPAEFCLIGEGPNQFDDRTGRCFSGKLQDELDRYLDGVDLPSRSDFFLTNLHREYKGKDYRYTAEDLVADEPALLAELAEVQPRIVVTMGRPATRYLLGDVDIDSVEGMPFRLPFDSRVSGVLGPETVVFPLVHISAGLFNPELSPYVVRGFREFGRFLAGEVEPRTLFADPIPNPVYEEVQDEMQLSELFDRSCRGQTVATQGRRRSDTFDGQETVQLPQLLRQSRLTPLGVDTEGWPGRGWSLQLSAQSGTGYLIDARNRPLLASVFDHLYSGRYRVVFHSALHDLAMLRDYGCNIDRIAFDDTMVMAYLLQLEPRGLKQGCLRYCNMKMLHYDEVIGETANNLALDYVTWLHDIEALDHERAQRAELLRLQTTPYTDKKGLVKPGRRVTKLPSVPKTALFKAVTRIARSPRPAGLWDDQVEDIHVAAYNRLGCEMPKATLDYVPRKVAVEYGCRDADATLRLEQHYSAKIDALGLRDVYNLELSTYPLIDRMQKIGVKPDLAHFAELSPRLQREIDQLQNYLEAGTGIDGFNANSGDQVAAYLFETCGLEPMKMTKGDGHGNGVRGSTNDKILEALEHEHPEVPLLTTIRAYRETYKLKNTFVDRLYDFTRRWPHDGRIHATFRTTRVVTGRLAASDPNLLAQPEHGAFAPDFKRGWICEPGHAIWAGDQSQVELRGLAHLSQDPLMCAIFRGEKRNVDGSMIDLHAQTAHKIFGGNMADYMKKCNERLAAKAVNFGIPMGMTNKGLSVELRKNGVDADEDTAQRWLDDTLSLYGGVRDFMEECKAEARRNGFIRCLSGRIRYIGGIRSRHARIREEAERFSFSTKIQESATFIMKQAEAIVYEHVLKPYWREGRWVEPILQVHDCLKIECEEGLVQDVHVKMVQAMTCVPKSFSVPLVVEGEYGWNAAPMVYKGRTDWSNPGGMRGIE